VGRRDRLPVSPTIVGVVAAAVMVTLLVVAFASINPFAHTITLHAQVASGDTLAPGADVEVAGVKIGSVRSIDRADLTPSGGAAGDPRSGALVTMTVDLSKSALYRDATADVRPHGVFGPKFLELAPGNLSAGEMADGDTISIDHTQVAVDFDQVLNELDADTRQSLSTFFYELGTASTDRGAQFGQTLDNLQIDTAQLVPPLQTIDSRSTELARFMENNATVNETLAASPLDSIIHENADVLAQLDRNHAKLADLMVHGDNVLGDLDTLTNGNVDALRATVAALPSLTDHLDQFNSVLGYGANWLAPELAPRGQGDSDIGLAIRRTADAFGECDVSGQPGYDTLHATVVNIAPCYGPDGKPYVDANGHVAHHHVKVLLGTHTGAPVGDQETGTYCSPDLADQSKHTAYSCIDNGPGGDQSKIPVPPLPPDGLGLGPTVSVGGPPDPANPLLQGGPSPVGALVPEQNVSLLDLLLSF
jgi:phospholipid/cholesterol/gamma-HCH transport system substrate-binding protein